jgi:hypothetical protein
MLAMEREKLLLEARAAAQRNEVAADVASGRKLMKEIGFELTQIFAGLALYYRPLIDGSNPNADEANDGVSCDIRRLRGRFAVPPRDWTLAMHGEVRSLLARREVMTSPSPP